MNASLFPKVVAGIDAQYNSGQHRRALLNATRLWNWIDGLDRPEPLWAMMADSLPWAFDDPSNVNTMRFTYIKYSDGHPVE